MTYQMKIEEEREEALEEGIAKGRKEERTDGIKNLIASRVDPKTCKYIGKNCHGKEKVRRFREKFGDVEIENFYSDSHSDDPMAEIAVHAYMIKGESIEEWT